MQTQTGMLRLFPTHSLMQKLYDDLYVKHGVTVYIKRDDLLHPKFGGNKARKLYGHFQAYIHENYAGWVSWGGPWSNHLHAFAAFSQKTHVPFRVIIRGKDLTYRTSLMNFIERCGGTIHVVSREQYTRTKSGDTSELQTDGIWYAVPEGGGGEPGKVGCRMLAEEIMQEVKPDRICLAVGTQTTLNGIAEKTSCFITGFSALKGMQQTDVQVQVTDEFCLGGYARTTDALFEFILAFYQKHRIVLDPVYTGKLMLGIHNRIACGNWNGETIVIIHSGGLQGIFGYPALLHALRKINPEILNTVYDLNE